ncbi:MAG: TonB-dependent receptor [Alphaproteobacteria bacterium PA2]|nr:MAG: TonB-dependent receptor [Alphaproteobacteria bacterium PA2]
MISTRQRALCGAAITLCGLWAPAALAQSMPRPAATDNDPAEVSELVVTGARALPGAVVGDVKAEVQISPAEIRAMGVTSAASLLAELAPQLRSSGGRRGGMPVVLVGGRRVSGFNEIRDLPAEAILRVDILPSEAALKFGYPADQRVINFVLRPRFRAKILEVQGGGATTGGAANGSADLGYLKIMGENRLNLNLKASASSGLTEDERDVVSATPVTTIGLSGLEALQRNRSLTPQTRSASLNAVYSRASLGGLATTFNGTLETSSRESRLGLPLVSLSVPAFSPFNSATSPLPVLRYVENNGPLIQSNQGWSGHLGGVVNKDQGKWRLSATAALDHAESRTESDAGLDPTAIQAALNSLSATVDPKGALIGGLLINRADNTARSQTDTANVQIQASGPLFHVPAGDVRVSVNLGDTETRLSTLSVRSGTRLSNDFSRSAQLVQGNIDIPIASTGGGIQGIGALSLNLNGNVTPISGFGSLTSIGYGANWNPMTGVNLIVSQNQDHGAPSLQQIGDPLVATPGVRVFDYATGRTVDITRLDGGNAALKADDRKTLKVGLTYRPLAEKDLTLSANYAASRNFDITGSLPAATAQVEAAFPGRFVRNAAGDLISIDNRPVNFAQEDRREVKLGLNYSMPVGPQPAPGAFPRPPGGAPGAGGARPAGGPPGGFRPGGGFGGPPMGGRMQFAIYDTIVLQDRILTRVGGPVLDQLNGAASGNSGGQARHLVEVQAGLFKNGMGARLNADWTSATTVKGTTPAGDLRFSDLAKVNLNLFADLGQQPKLVKAHPWLRASRVSLSVSNLFDAHQEVRDASGATPVGYQAAYLDPTGRTFRVSLRKVFF